MIRRRLKKPVIYTLYGIGFILIMSSIFMIQRGLYSKDPETDYVNKTIFEDIIPVVGETDTKTEQIIYPYNDQSVKVIRNYYDYKSDEETQKSSIIYYEGTYIPSTGITYKGESDFDVVSILDGVVTSVKQDELLGNVIEIKHDNIISVYQSVNDILVKENDTVKQGQVISKSGVSNIDSASENHLYFELIVNNETVNPTGYFGKFLNEI